jgi:hypothetical protein
MRATNACYLSITSSLLRLAHFESWLLFRALVPAARFKLSQGVWTTIFATDGNA